MALNWEANRRRANQQRQPTVVKGEKKDEYELPPLPRNLSKRPIPNPPMERIKSD